MVWHGTFLKKRPAELAGRICSVLRDLVSAKAPTNIHVVVKRAAIKRHAEWYARLNLIDNPAFNMRDFLQVFCLIILYELPSKNLRRACPYRSGRPVLSGNLRVAMSTMSTMPQIPQPPRVKSFRMPRPVYPR